MRQTAARLDLIGFVKGRFRYKLDDNEVMEISVPAALGDAYQQIQVRAQPFSPMIYYRMDAALTSSETLLWPVKDVLKPKELPAREIGVYGYKEDKRDSGESINIYLPVEVKSRMIGRQNDSDLRMYFSSFVDIDYLFSEWRCGNRQIKRSESREIHRSGKPIVIFPPADLEGLCLLYLQAIIKQRDSGGAGNRIDKYLAVQLVK